MKESINSKIRFNLRALFYNNKFVLVFSLILAFGIWLWVAINKSPVVENVIVSVPVQIDMAGTIPEQLGLKIFGNTDYTVDVTVSGKKFIVSALSTEDIKVTAQTNYVDSAGNKTLTLKAVNDSNKEFDIVSLSQNYISVYFDTLKEAEFALKANVTSEISQTVPDGCLLGDAILSKNTVVVSGPSTEVNRITGVNASYVITKMIEQTTTLTPSVELVGASPMQLTNVTVDTGDTSVTMTIPVLKEVTLPTAVSFKNAPADVLTGNINLTVSPATVKVGVPIEKLEQMKELTVGNVDFSEIDVGVNNFKFDASEHPEYRYDDSITSFRVTIRMNNYDTKNVNLPVSNVSFTKEHEGFLTNVTQGVNGIKLIGPSEDLASISEENIYAEVDLSAFDLKEGVNTVPVKIVINGTSTCWAYGEYTIKVNCSAV
ncbi:MAG: hypothetical protein E7514_07095 [Ruminococcaceae bacterium]|nr:hypothetical protein [Oscillospiraceae bacterium]